MRSHLGYQVSDTNVSLARPGDSAIRLIDVRGETYGLGWYRLRHFAVVAFVVGLVLRNVLPVAEGNVPVLPTLLFYAAALSYCVAQIGRWRTRRYAWVECKDLKRAIGAEDVMKLHDAVQQVKGSARADWKPAVIILVAGDHGFSSEGLQLAQAQGMSCYRRSAAGFDPVN
ncbi:MAG TPA: hypothetical protein VL137_07515 [Polyangiaceae bacterium]|jgi:hypothetical protein|nr:hypothetical protein [Polyangiaceae bacterium]